jgi:DNA-binding GntR family transcriptional regulator
MIIDNRVKFNLCDNLHVDIHRERPTQMAKSKQSFDLNRIPVAEQIKQELVRRISNGELPAGSRLTELAIAKEFRASQGPVREAFRQLEVMDIVETQPYKGTYVRAVSIEDMKDAYAVRAPLEQLIGELAAKKLKGHVDSLRDRAELIRKAAERNDVVGYAHHDLIFHRSIVEAAGKRILLRVWDTLVFEGRVATLLAESEENLTEVQRVHWDIIDALGAGKGVEAGRLLRRHIGHFSH